MRSRPHCLRALLCAALVHCGSSTTPADSAVTDALAETSEEIAEPREDHGSIDASLDGPDVSPPWDGSMDIASSSDGRYEVDAAPRDRVIVDAGPRCYPASTPQDAGAALLTHVARIPRETAGANTGITGCIGDVDRDGAKEFVLLRLNEPSELIGSNLCSRGRVLLPAYARGCLVAEVDGDRSNGNEVIVYGSDDWRGEGSIHVGRIVRSAGTGATLEAYRWQSLWTLDEQRAIAPFNAPHVGVVDLDRDGLLEIVAAGNSQSGFVRVWEFDPTRRTWVSLRNDSSETTPGGVEDTSGVLIGDVNGDTFDDVLIPASCSRTSHNTRLWRGGAGRGWDVEPELFVRSLPIHPVLAPLSSSASHELVFVERNPCSGSTSVPRELRVARYDGGSDAFAVQTSTVPSILQPDHNYLAAVDLLGSSVPEIVLCTAATSSSNTRRCRVYEYRSSPPSLVDLRFEWSGLRVGTFDAILVDDWDGDGAPELFLTGQHEVDVLRGRRP
jgi:hypothetical protein